MCFDLDSQEPDYEESKGRIVGYDRFDANLPYPIKPGGLSDQQKIERNKAEADSNIEIEKVKAQAQVEAAKHNLESYKDAQAAESEKMLRMMEIMQGKKKKEDDE